MRVRKLSNPIPVRKKLIGAFFAISLFATPQLAVAGKFNWKAGAAAAVGGASQAIAEQADRNIQLEPVVSG